MTSHRGLALRAVLPGLIVAAGLLAACGQHSTSMIQMLPGSVSPGSGADATPPCELNTDETNPAATTVSNISKDSPFADCASTPVANSQWPGGDTRVGPSDGNADRIPDTPRRPHSSTPQQIFSSIPDTEIGPGFISDELVGAVLTGVGEYLYQPGIG